jgi:KUP system potassium uptake protein
MLGILCIALVIGFKKSANLADAYGLAVTITMLTTTIGYAALTRTAWHWAWWQTAIVTAFFLSFDGSFLIGNIPKIPTGGWIPLAIAIMVFTLFVTWFEGRRRQAAVLSKMTMPVDEFLRQLDASPQTPRAGTAVFLTAHPEGVPYALKHEWLRAHVMFEVVVLLRIETRRRPYVPEKDRIVLEELRENSFYRVTAHYGFMETPDPHEILHLCRQADPDYDFKDATFYLAESTIVAAKGPEALPRWQRMLFAWMVTNARPISMVLDLPVERVVTVGVTVPV